MNVSRRDFGKFALGTIPVAAGVLANPERLFSIPAAKPNSYINGVQIGVISYSYRSMPDATSAEAVLGYILADGISACELEVPVWPYAYKRMNFTPPARGGFGGGFGGAGRGPGGAAPQAPPPPGPAVAGEPSWNGLACPAGRGGGGAGAARGAAGGPGGGRAPLTPEQQAAQDDLHKFQLNVSLDIFKDLKKMYDDAGVSIYAVKILDVNADDEMLDKQFQIGKTMGATHLTGELPPHSDTSTATFKKVGEAALRNGMFAAYHSHLQGRMDAFDEAFAASKGNKSNVDFGHYVAAGEIGGTPMDFLMKYHDRIGSFHLKDRTKPEHCELNLAWGQGETPIKEILQLVQKNKWPIPATIEQEYQIPSDSDAVKEVSKCLAYCRAALT
jgi:sugar phosphate isomerase/epimerase